MSNQTENEDKKVESDLILREAELKSELQSIQKTLEQRTRRLENQAKIDQMNRRGFIKILPADLKSRGFQFQEGLNVDVHPLSEQICAPGGFCFTLPKDMWFDIGPMIADVTFDIDSKFVELPNDVFKSDRIILSNIRPIGEHPIWNNYEFVKKISHRNASMPFIKHEFLVSLLAQTREKLAQTKRKFDILSFGVCEARCNNQNYLEYIPTYSYLNSHPFSVPRF